ARAVRPAASARPASLPILPPKTSRISPSNSAFRYFRIVRETIKRRARDTRGPGAQPPSSVGEQLTSGVDHPCSSAHLPLKESFGYLAQVAQGGCHRSAPCHDYVFHHRRAR